MPRYLYPGIKDLQQILESSQYPENKTGLAELTRCPGTFSRELKSSQVARNKSWNNRDNTEAAPKAGMIEITSNQDLVQA